MCKSGPVWTQDFWFQVPWLKSADQSSDVNQKCHCHDGECMAIFHHNFPGISLGKSSLNHIYHSTSQGPQRAYWYCSKGNLISVVRSRQKSAFRCWGWGNSLAIQWLELHTVTAEGLNLIPGQGTKIPQALWHNQKQTTTKKWCWDWGRGQWGMSGGRQVPLLALASPFMVCVRPDSYPMAPILKFLPP